MSFEMSSRSGIRDVAAAFGLLTGRWMLAILDELAIAPIRHSELLRAVDGVSEKVLTETLRRIERDGLVAVASVTKTSTMSRTKC